MKQLLTIIPYMITSNEIYHISEMFKNRPRGYIFKQLPEFSINKDYGNILYTENYHQFTGMIPDENDVFYMFNLINNGDLLSEEISNCGLEDLIENYDWRPLFNKIPTNSFKKLCVPFNVHIIIELNYIGDYEDVETEIKVLGYLDNNLDLIKI